MLPTQPQQPPAQQQNQVPPAQGMTLQQACDHFQQNADAFVEFLSQHATNQAAAQALQVISQHGQFNTAVLPKLNQALQAKGLPQLNPMPVLPAPQQQAPQTVLTPEQHYQPSIDRAVWLETTVFTKAEGALSLTCMAGVPRFVYGVASLIVDLARVAFNVMAMCWNKETLPVEGNVNPAQAPQRQSQAWAFAKMNMSFVKHDLLNIARALLVTLPGTALAVNAQNVRYGYGKMEGVESTPKNVLRTDLGETMQDVHARMGVLRPAVQQQQAAY